MLRKCLFHRNHRRHCLLYHLLAGAVAGVAGATDFLSSFLAELLVAGFLASSLTTGLGASALVTAGVATGVFGASAANTDTANTDAITNASDFILVSFWVNAELYLHILITH